MNSCNKCTHSYVCLHRKELTDAFIKITKWKDEETDIFISRVCRYFSGIETSKTFVEDMDLSVRLLNVFERHNIKTLEDILSLGADNLMCLKKLGFTCLEEIGRKIQKYGVELHDMEEVSRPIYLRLKQRLLNQ